MKPIRASNSEAPSRLSWVIRNASAKDAEVDIFDVIGDPWEGTSAKDFVQQLRGITAENIRININSPGGFVDDALAIYDAILSHPAHTTAHITVAASAASFVAMAADKRVITKNGKVQIHDAHAFVGVMDVVNPDAIDSVIESLVAAKALLEEESNNIASIYAERAGGTAAEWRGRMKANGPHGTTYRGQEAINVGLADELATAPARNTEPSRIAALADEPNPLESLDIPPLAAHAGYRKPVPDLAGLFAKHPLKVGGK
jgi:ATP-dependent protease ClpP protease subunit